MLEQQQRTDAGELARKMSGLLLAELSLGVVFDRLSEVLSAFVQATTVTIVLRNPDASFLQFRYDHGALSQFFASELGEQELKDTITTGTSHVSSSPALAAMPLQLADETIGAISIESEGLAEYGQEQIAMIESIVPYVAVAVRNRMLQNAVERERYRAEHDPLTGLANRLLFTDRLTQSLQRARRSQLLVGVVYADLNGFKPINDTLGHAAGDEVLRTIARRLKEQTRASDTVARLGGDEFAMIVEQLHNRSELEKIVQNLKNAIASPIPLHDRPVNVGVSFGCSIFPQDGGDAAALLHVADAAMYAVKKNTRLTRR
ncbi:MAG: GGDEF domain-containing protein [Candidatus Eremiobacteraeota bacterium]|nr:GGDEF domain-containing protein [Candidatus Eremiobacteraeota bacterium]